MKVLVIVVTWNGIPWLDRCLGSIRASEIPATVYVYDNCSSDGTVDHIVSHYPEVVIQKSPSNVGFARANNAGLRYAYARGYDYVYLMNQDAWLFPDTLGKLLEVAEAHPELGVLSPMQLAADGSPDANFARRALPVKGEPFYKVPFVMAAHWLVSRRCLETAGLFAPIFPFNGEDDNYCHRVLYHGLGVAVVPGAKAVHDRSERDESPERVIYRNFRMTALAALCDIRRPLWLQRARVAVYALVKAVKYRSRLPWRHLDELKAMLPQVLETRRASREVAAFLQE